MKEIIDYLTMCVSPAEMRQAILSILESHPEKNDDYYVLYYFAETLK